MEDPSVASFAALLAWPNLLMRLAMLSALMVLELLPRLAVILE